MIERYTRPELAEVWSEHGHFEAMREVEVAACEELEGPTQHELEAIRAATFTVEAIAERERVTDHDVAAFVDVLQAAIGQPQKMGLLRADAATCLVLLRLAPCRHRLR